MAYNLNEDRSPAQTTMPRSNKNTLRNYNVTGTLTSELEIFRYDRYATFKTAGIGLLDITLIVDTATRMRRVIYLGSNNTWYLPIIALLSALLVLQIIEGILLVCLGMQNVEVPAKQAKLVGLNITAVVLAGFIAVSNIVVLQFMSDVGIQALMSTVSK